MNIKLMITDLLIDIDVMTRYSVKNILIISGDIMKTIINGKKEQGSNNDLGWTT